MSNTAPASSLAPRIVLASSRPKSRSASRCTSSPRTVVSGRGAGAAVPVGGGGVELGELGEDWVSFPCRLSSADWSAAESRCTAASAAPTWAPPGAVVSPGTPAVGTTVAPGTLRDARAPPDAQPVSSTAAPRIQIHPVHLIVGRVIVSPGNSRVTGSSHSVQQAPRRGADRSPSGTSPPSA